MRKRKELAAAKARFDAMKIVHQEKELAWNPEDSSILTVPKWRREAVLERERFLRSLSKAKRTA